jgi:threonylcarbamoyladenosine tRNA methylthiotransferase MtaB
MGEAKAVTVALETLGCKLNQAETELLARELSQAGYWLVPPEERADIFILHTCTVTHIADRKSRHLLRSARRHNPDVLSVATGCYAERAPHELAGIPGVKLVVGNKEKPHLLQLLRAAGKTGNAPPRQPAAHLRTRTLLKVQDGCHDPCSYCIVPRTRGRERSLPAEQLIGEVKARITAGYKEVVLTGTKIGSYRQDGLGLKHLLERLLAETAVPRLRLSSLQPQEISPDLIRLWENPRLCRHFHLPLQSGCEAVLHRMRRSYSPAEYQRAVELIRTVVPHAAITTDIIVGFPGESEEEFEGSRRFCQEREFAAIHVFPYSPRAGTPAAHMPAQVEPQVKRERKQRMLDLAGRTAHHFRQRFLGQAMEVLWEREVEAGTWSGLTDNYIRVFTRSKEPLTNRLLPAQLSAMNPRGLWGEVAR